MGTGRTRRAESGENAARRRSRIAAVGVCLPDRRVTTAEVLGSCARAADLDLERLTGVAERRVAAPDEDSRTLAVAAARDCLRRAGVEPSDLDVVIYTGVTKYDGGLAAFRREPGLGTLVREALGAKGALAFDLGNACAGMLTGLFVLDGFIRRGVVRRGLLVGGELVTHLSRNAAGTVTGGRHPETASLTLGDAGAALLVEAAAEGEAGVEAMAFRTIASHVDLCAGFPCEEAPGARMVTRATEIHAHGIAGTPAIVRSALEACGRSLADVDCVIMHQTAVPAIRRCRTLCREALGPGNADWVVTVDRFGNTASTSHALALHERLRQERLAPADRVLLITQASGLVLGAVLFTAGELAGGACAH